MANEEPKKVPINPNYLVIGGLALGGIYLVYKLVSNWAGVPPENREQAEKIMVQWQDEFDQTKQYSQSIYANGRIPTDAETAALSAMLENMQLKELTIYNLSEPTWKQLANAVRSMAISLGISVGAVAVGYGAIALIRKLKNRNNPPPNFPCPRGDGVFTTEGALKYHIQNQHQTDNANADEAKESFDSCSSWVQNAVAVETYYGLTFSNWSFFNLSEIRGLNWGLTSGIVYGIGSATELTLLRTALLFLMI